ncbi:hypothetical protein BVC80_8425g10 [Macleaya cordata]|uniref:Uncharacterized protein n=1 Tax=Macleaya cordata TaxID=56857 RepID=A0A200QXG9_MACCD|nr:hypothetical protein BVC80_8425g10 [Macleaya cordata]
MRITNSWFSSKGRTKRAIQESVAGIVTGMLTSLISIILIKVLQRSIPRLAKVWDARNCHLAVYAVYLKRACFLVVYFSVVGWLTIQYGKMLGLPDLFISS